VLGANAVCGLIIGKIIVHETPTNILAADDLEIHVWSAILPEVIPALPTAEKYLSKQERETAGRFFHAADRMRYILAHGILRDLLSRYMQVDPVGLQFIANEFGKPDLAAIGTQPALRFNLAHSGDVILYAITQRRQVGIDVEKIRADVDVMELAASQFADQEIKELRRLSLTERQDAFYRVWTRKEAYIKALGTGLSLALNKFAVTVGTDKSIEVSWAEGDPEAARKWAMFDVDTHPEYAAAVVVEAGRPVRVVYRSWNSGAR
jgi:4'-phosphopantetheinyl transferase